MKKFINPLIITSALTLTMILGISFSACEKKSIDEYVPPPLPSPSIIFPNRAWSSSSSVGMYQLSLPNVRLADIDPNYLLEHIKIFLKPAGTTNWIILPFVNLANISLTNHIVFYTIDDTDPDWYNSGGPVFIYANQNAGINFSQLAAAGITYIQ